MDFSFDSVIADESTGPFFNCSTAGAGSSNIENSSNPTEIDMSSFKTDGFSDFALDLSCLSNPSSPSSPSPVSLSSSDKGMNILPTPSPSSPLLLPVDESAHSSPAPEPPSKISTINRATSMMRMSLPALKYIGRGTPIDPGRRSEWGGRKSEDVTEDGMLFDGERGDRARSLDSHMYPHRHSFSADWQAVPVSRALSPLHMDIDSSLENHMSRFLEPLPESSKIQLQVDSDPTEWESVMRTVLGSSGATPSNPISPDGEATPSRRDSQGPIPGLPQHPNGLDIVLGLNSALDLGLGLGKGMNFFDLGLIPDTGRDTPSVYSSAPESPEPTRSPSVENPNHSPENGQDNHPAVGPKEQHQQQEHLSSDDGGSRSITAEAHPPVFPFEPKAMRDVHRIHWWRRAMSKFRKVQKFIKTPGRV